MSNDILTGVWPAATLPFTTEAAPFTAETAVDIDRFADHCRWLVDSGCDGVVVNGSLGEYEALTDDERETVVRTAVAAVGAARVIPGVAGKSAAEALAWTTRAVDLDVPAVMCLPPTSHAPSEDEVVAHYRHVAQAGVPIIAYNNPFSTRVDLVPALLARIHTEVPLVRAVKEFSTDVRRVLGILDLAPDLQVVCGCDDVLVESVLMGARGWIAGFVNAFPQQSAELYRLAVARKLDDAVALYREMLPILRWDADPRFVQAIKLAQEEAGRYGGPCRLPRLPLPAEDQADVRRQARRALAAGGGGPG